MKFKRRKKLQPTELDKPTVPRCQHCGVDPAPLSPCNVNIEGIIMMVLHCANPNCRALHAIIPIGKANPQPQQRPTSPLIVPPSGFGRA